MSTESTRTRPTVVVVGAGFGGLAVVHGLRRAPVDVLLVDEHNYHLFQPLLYQVGTAVLDPSQIAHPVRPMLRKARNADFRLARVEGIEPVMGAVPALGQHSEEILGELGFDPQAIAAFRREGTI